MSSPRSRPPTEERNEERKQGSSCKEEKKSKQKKKTDDVEEKSKKIDEKKKVYDINEKKTCDKSKSDEDISLSITNKVNTKKEVKKKDLPKINTLKSTIKTRTNVLKEKLLKNDPELTSKEAEEHAQEMIERQYKKYKDTQKKYDEENPKYKALRELILTYCMNQSMTKEELSKSVISLV
jgi:hypothetical protein